MKLKQFKSFQRLNVCCVLRIFNSKVFKFFILSFLILVSIFNMSSVFLSNKVEYLSTDYWARYPSLKTAYYNSVYANKHGNFIPDEIVYAFNGGALIQGVSPILVNPETPPAGKYLIGLSILLFKNEHIIIFIFGILSLVMMYLVGRQITKSLFVPMVALALVTFEPFFRNQFVYTPLMEIFQLVFLLSSFYFFNVGYMSKNKTIIW